MEDFERNRLVVDATLRNLEIIGEAVSHLPAAVTAKHPATPWTDIRGMRNVVAHEYYGVRLPIIWKSITVELPKLGAVMREILETEAEDQ